MASQGQRFRRRALRRGYKVDEVDAFLDRVEATLAGEPVGAPVAAQEVHDVVFRVRFGGYDEWQVDLHLDRVERQLAELEERGGSAGRGAPTRVTGWARRTGIGPPMRDDRGLSPVPRSRCRRGRCRAGRPAATAATTSRPAPSPAGTTPPAAATTRRAARWPAPGRCRHRVRPDGRRGPVPAAPDAARPDAAARRYGPSRRPAATARRSRASTASRPAGTAGPT